MTTSGVTAWSLTARDLVTAGLRDARILGSGEEPTADEMADCLIRLNGLLKSWSTRGNLFREATGEVEVVGGSASGILSEGIRDISSVRHVISATNERQLTPWNRAQYLSLPNKAAVGNPSIYYLSQQGEADILYLWPVPAADITLKIDYSRTVETVTDPGETLDIPQEWQTAVWKNLAVECQDLFGATLTPIYIAKAEALYQQFLDSDRPDSYVFESYSDYG